jgi:putative phosphoribosyl transferase
VLPSQGWKVTMVPGGQTGPQEGLPVEVAVLFADRVDAGRQLAARLANLRGEPVVVLGLPRGGVPVALPVALALGAPLDVIIVRKLGVPFQPELGVGAVGEDGVVVIDTELLRLTGMSAAELARIRAREQGQVAAGAARYRAHRQREPLEGRIAVVVDHGIATGSTARAACLVARAHGATRVVLAVPVAPPGWERGFRGEADELVSVYTPAWFHAIGQFYADFTQTIDEEVIACLERAATPVSAASASTAAAADPPARARKPPVPGARKLSPPSGSPSGRVLDHAAEATRDRGVRPRQSQQPTQPTQPVRRQPS